MTYSDHLWTILEGIIGFFKLLFKEWHIRKTINFSNFLKLLFIYVISIIWVFVIYFELSPGFWGKALSGEFSDRRISIYGVEQRIGEVMLHKRIMEYARENKYDYSAARFPESLTRFTLTKHFFETTANVVNYIFKPNFNLSISHHIDIIPAGYNVVYLTMPRHSLYSAFGGFLGRWEHLNRYDVYIDLYSFSNGKNELLYEIVGDKPIIPGYLAQSKTDFKPVENFDKALTTGSMWGCNRGSLRYKLALKKLANDGVLVAMGLLDYAFLGENFLGKIEKYQNKNSILETLILQQRKYGIALLVHNQEHMMDGIPTSRISEAAASNVVIISDRNKFIERFFTDSVLYYDIYADENDIYEQILEHIKWIKANPVLAKKKADKAHKLFNEYLTIEKQMENVFKTINVLKNK